MVNLYCRIQFIFMPLVSISGLAQEIDLHKITLKIPWTLLISAEVSLKVLNVRQFRPNRIFAGKAGAYHCRAHCHTFLKG